MSVPVPVSSSTERVWFLDNMRFVLVLIVIVFHCILSQVAFFEDAIVHDPRSLSVAAWFCFFCYAFQMPLMFFIAGYFAVSSLKAKGTVGFVRSKVFRLLIPGAIVLVVLNPVHRYLYHWSRAFEEGIPAMSYLEYLPHFFRGVTWFEVESLMLTEFSILHLWFVSLLFTFFIAYALLERLSSGKGTVGTPKTSDEPKTPCTRRTILVQMSLVAAISWLASAAILPFFLSFQWVMILSFLDIELPSVALHATFFALGVAAHRHNWFADPNAIGSVWAWLAIAVPMMAGVIFVDEVTTSDPTMLESYPVALGYWALKAVSTTVFLGLFLSFMIRFMSRTSPIRQVLAKLSYRVYLLHFSVVSCVQFAFFKMPGLSPYSVLFGTIIVSLSLTYLFVISVSPLASWYARMVRSNRLC